MAEFSGLTKLVAKRFADMSAGELFEVNITPDAMYDLYIASFPEGTNPTFRESTEHDCSTCRNFIKNLGNVVSIKDGNIVTVWDVKGAPSPYKEVAEALAEHIRTLPITSIYRTTPKFRTFGVEYNTELREGKTIRWHHLHGVVDSKHVLSEDQFGKVRGDYNTTVHIFKRGLEELNNDSFQTVLDLIDAKALYRGEEHRAAIQEFQKVQREYLKLDSAARQVYLWSKSSTPVARFRNTVIGTLITDLSDGEDIEVAVKKFESKVAPENYKRTTALITPAMIKQAMKTIQDLGIEDALHRRHARLSDVNVNDVLWSNGSARAKMKGGIEDLLMSAAVKPVGKVEEHAEDISIADFMANVLPRTKTMDMMVKNHQMSNFVSITAPKFPDTGSLFKWNNDFAWSYDGNIADSALRQQVANLGGRVDGVLRFTHTWNHAARNASLMDLHVFMPGSGHHTDGNHDRYPSGQRVGWNMRTDRMSGGKQDVDYTTAAPEGYVPVENITFPDMAKLKEGQYTFKIHNWAFRPPTKGGFRAEIEFGGQIFQYDYIKPLANKEWVTVAVATLKNGVFTIDHKLPTTSTSQQKWGVNTEQFVKVETLMMSPNYWGNNSTGNKHWFFILEGCTNPDPTRGIYNEFLNSKLDPHRKVFEVLGAQTKCESSEEQLSGVGFSSTKNDKVIVRVTGDKLHKLYNISF